MSAVLANKTEIYRGMSANWPDSLARINRTFDGHEVTIRMTNTKMRPFFEDTGFLTNRDGYYYLGDRKLAVGVCNHLEIETVDTSAQLRDL